jgi:hypothetical protein
MLPSALPGPYLTDFMEACHTKLEHFMTADTMMGEDKIIHLADIDESMNLVENDIKTFAIKINPYKRIYLWYLDAVNIVHPDWVVDFTSLKGDFPRFVEEYLTVIPEFPKTYYDVQNSYPLYYGDTVEVDYLIEFDNFLEDVKQIPEFSTDTINYLQQAQDDVSDYKDYYTDAAKAKVAEVFAIDIENYGYTF